MRTKLAKFVIYNDRLPHLKPQDPFIMWPICGLLGTWKNIPPGHLTFIYLFIYLLIYLFIYLFIHLFTMLSIATLVTYTN